MAREPNRDEPGEPAAGRFPPPRGGEEADEAETSDPIEAASYGEIIEVRPDDDVDGDFNGAPELAGIEQTRDWSGVDALGAMRGREAQQTNLADDAPAALRAAELEQLRAELVERLESLRADLPETLIADESAAPEGEDTLSDAALTADALAARIARIDAAIERLENAGYGICVRCGRDIEPARLDAAPNAERCGDCEAAIG